MTRFIARVACALTGCALLVFGAGAAAGQTTSFGADLTQAVPNISPTCPNGYPISPGLPLVQVGFATCTWTYEDYSTNTGLFIPTTGTVTRVSIRVGGQTGPMQIVVMRWVIQNASDGGVNKVCCVITAATPSFTPAANQITTLTTSLPATHDAAPRPGEARIAAQDMLGVTVDDATTVIPLVSTANPSGLLTDFVLYPGGTAPALTPLSEGYSSGYVVPINADVRAGAESLALSPAVLVPQGTVTRVTKAGAVPLLLACRGDAVCQGVVQLLSQNTGALRGHATAARSYGSASYRITAGARGRIKVHLNAAGRNLLRTRRSARIWVRISTPGKAPRTARIRLSQG